MREPVEPDKVSGLGLATGLFTLIPSRPVSTIDRDAGRRAIMWFPWLGLLIGLVGGVAAWAVTMRGGPLLGALIGLGLIELITGFMHLDGIADTADGLGASAKPANDAKVREHIGKYIKLPPEVLAKTQISPPGPVVSEKQLTYWVGLMKEQEMLKTEPKVATLIPK